MDPLSPAPLVTDGRVSLRPHTLDDVPAMVAMCRDPQTLAWTTVPRPYSADDAREYLTGFVAPSWADRSDLTWAVSAPDDEGVARFAGNLSLRPGPPVDLGFSLHPWARGRGVMSAAVRLASAWAFEELAAEVVQWQANAGNLGSWRVAWACGFTFTGEEPLLLPGWDGRLRDAWRGVLRPGEPMTVPRTRWLTPPVLDALPGVLRPARDGDAARMVEAGADPQAQYWLVMLPREPDETTAREAMTRSALAMSRGTEVTWSIADPVDDQFLGRLSVFGIGDPVCPCSAEVGYWAHPDARGRGVISAAVRAAAGWALGPDGPGLHRLGLSTSWENVGSRRVAEAAGFAPVGHFRLDGVLGDGRLEDGAFYDRLAEGLEASHPR